MTTRTRRHFDDLTASQQAGLPARQPQFQTFAAAQCGMAKGQRFGTEAAAQFIRMTCGVTSRRDLTHTPTARARFNALRTDFDAWRGRIPAQRMQR